MAHRILETAQSPKSSLSSSGPGPRLLRMTFKTWYFRGVFKEDFELDFEGYFKGTSRDLQEGV